MKIYTTLTALCIFFVWDVWAQTPQTTQEKLKKQSNVSNQTESISNGKQIKQIQNGDQDSELKITESLRKKIRDRAPKRSYNLKPYTAVQQQSKEMVQSIDGPKPLKIHKNRSGDYGFTSSTAGTTGSGNEGTLMIPKDNPEARAAFEVLRTKDPATGRIPINIRQRELEFMRIQNQKIGVPFASGDLSSPWVNRGPYNVGGRTRALAVDVNDENTILAGGVSGGMWRTTDFGTTWAKTTGSNELQSVSCLAQDPRSGETSTWYYGTGEISGNSAGDPGAPYRGDGVYKSTDNGATWTILSATSTDTPESFDQGFDYNYEIVVNPINGDVLVANYFGVYLSTDGGTSFTLTLENTDFSGQWVDIIMTSTGLAYAVVDDRGVFSSSDGTNWTDITPASDFPLVGGERKELALAPSNENVFYLLGEDASNTSAHSLWKYDASNTSWTDLSDNVPQLGGLTGDFDSQGGYDLLIKVKTDDENFVVIGGTNLFASTDGFASTGNTSWIGGYTALNTSYALYANHHPDQHSFVFLANNRALSGSDGGVALTEDITDVTTNANSETVDWISLNNGYLTTQVYALSGGPGDQIMAGFQDNGTWLTIDTDPTVDWSFPFGGDGAYSAFNSDGTVRFLSSQNGNIYRFNYSDADDINVNTFAQFTPSGYAAGLFIVPFYLDPINDDLFYLAGNSLFYVNTQATTGSSSIGWKTINLGTSGVVSEIGVTGSNSVYVGTSAGEVFKVDNPGGSSTVTNVSGSSFPSGYVSSIAVNRLNPSELIVTFSNYSIPSVFHSSDGGNSWTDISGSLEENTDGTGSGPSARSSQIMGNADRYFVGTSAGLYSTTSLDGTSTVWTQENSSGIGDVVVDHLVSRPSDGLILAGTHGNGVFSAKFETSGQPDNDLALTGITSPDGLVSGEEPISVIVRNLGTVAQAGVSLSYYVNETLISTETVSGALLPDDEVHFTFDTPYDFSTPGEYDIRVEINTSDEVPGNNTISKTVVNALFTGKYLLQQVDPTTSGPSANFVNGYLFDPSGSQVIDIVYIDSDTRAAQLSYLPAFNNGSNFFEWDMVNTDVIFGDQQATGLTCGGTGILLGTATAHGLFDPTSDLEFTLTLREDITQDCGAGSPDVTFMLTKVFDNDLGITSIDSPNLQETLGSVPVTVSIINTGANAQSNFEVSYYINDDLIASETVLQTLESGMSMQYTFVEEYEFQTGGTYELVAKVNLDGDERPANNDLNKTIEVIELTGFTGPYVLEQLSATTSSPSAVFAGGYLFDPSGMTDVYLQDNGGFGRLFQAVYLPSFTSNVNDFTFTLDALTGETSFDNEQNTSLGCGGGIVLGTADTPGSFDITDDTEFTLNIKEDLNDDCGTGTTDVMFRLVKAPEFHDLAVIDIVSPNDIFPSSIDQTVQVLVHNFSNIPQSNFEVTYFVDGVEIATQVYEDEIFLNQSAVVSFDTGFDFTTPALYDITATVSLSSDEDATNDSYTKTVQSLEPIGTFPYLQSFEDDNGSFPVGWDNFGSWQLTTGPTPNDRTGPDVDNTSGTGYFAYVNTTGDFFDQQSLMTRHVDLSGLTSPLLTFYYHMYGTRQQTLGVFVNGQLMFSVSGQQQSSSGEAFRLGSANLVNFGDQVVQVEFRVTNPGEGISGDVAIDDVGIGEAAEHDLSVRRIVSPVGLVDGERRISATIENLGRRAQADFEVSYYVNDTKISTEIFQDVIRAGEIADFNFETTYDFSAAGLYDIKVLVDLPADEVPENDAFTRTVANGIPFTGVYRMQQTNTTSAGPSANVSNGNLFSNNGITHVELIYIDETTRGLNLTYLEGNGGSSRDFEFTFGNGEVIFTDNQSSGLFCNTEILLGTADNPGFYTEGQDLELTLTLKEDITDDCAYGSTDVEFVLTKRFRYDLMVTNINSPAPIIPLSRQGIGFTVQNVGRLPQGDFDASFAINGNVVATETFRQPNELFATNSRNFNFNTPYEFDELANYDLTVSITRASDDNPTNDEMNAQIQTSAYNINASPISNNRIGIEWIELSATQNIVLERTDAAGNFVDLVAIQSGMTSYVDEDVDAVSFYAYRLRGELTSGEVIYSNEVTAQASTSGDFMFHKVLGDPTGVDLSNNTYSASWGDLDLDGDMDLVVSNVPNFNPNLSLRDAPTVFLNDGSGNFTKVSGSEIVDNGVSSRSTNIIDYNNDEKPDVFLSAYNSRIGDFDNRLFRNNGNFDFSTVDAPDFRKNFNSEEASWADVDNDGDLDLFVAGNWFAGNEDFLFRNRGGGEFESIKEGTIYNTLYNSGLYSWGASWVDYDNDGDQDLFIPIDGNLAGVSTTAKLFKNNGNDGFEDVTDSPIVEEGISVRGHQWADFDQDGLLDLLLIETNVAPIFYFNDGAGNFTKVSSLDALGSNLNVHRISSVGDIDNNGKLDLIFASNGYFVYESNNDRTFSLLNNVLPPVGSEGPFAGISFADMDNDGDLDMFRGNASSGNSFNVLYENQGNSNNWLHINLNGEFSNADGIGAHIALTAGGETQYRTVTTSTGLIGQNSLLVEFGLGSNTKADHIVVTWPSGTVKEFFDIQSNQLIDMDDSNAPTDVALSNAIIPEGLSSGSAVGASFTQDNDDGDTHTYEIVGSEGIAGGANIYTSEGISKFSRSSDKFNQESIYTARQLEDDGANFFIDGGTIKAASEFDFEQQSSYNVRVRSTDQFGNTFEKELVIEILDVNEEIENSAPTDIGLTALRIDENEPANSVIGTLSAIDSDEGSSHTYSLVDGEANFFEIDGDQLLTTESFDFEEQSEYTITIRTIDDGGLSLDKEYVISVDNVNEEPVRLTLSNDVIAEDLVSGSLVGELATEDIDNDDTHSYSLSGDDGDSFQISGNELLTLDDLDFESITEYNITITTTDEDGLSLSEDFVIEITDANDAPAELNITGTTIAELLPEGSVIGTMSTSDDDATDTHTYSLSGEDADKFKVLDNELRSEQEFNFEDINEYEITLTVSDDEGLSYSSEVVIEVTDANDSPSELNLSNNTVPEELDAGTIVGVLSTSDEDAADTHTYTFVSGTGDDDNSSFTLDGNVLKTGAQFDFETQPTFSVLINVSDGNGGDFESQFTVELTDIDETSPNLAPVDMGLSATSISENEIAGTTVGTLSSTDPDAGDTHTYSIVDGASSLFDISSDELITAAEFNFEEESSYSITIRTTDAGGLIYDETYTIDVTDINEAPNSLSMTNDELAENEAVGTVVATLSATDDDAGDTQTYSLSGTDAANFQIVDDELQTAVELNFEDQNSHDITITVTDAGGLTLDQNVTINVNDVNEVPSQLALSSNSIAEGTSEGTTIGNLTTTDVDDGDSHTYALSGTDAASFQIIIDELRTNDDFDFESKSTYDITITTTDEGGLEISENFTIDITDANDAPTALTLSSDEIAEAEAAGSVVGTLSLTDEDANDTESYVISGIDADDFQIVGNELQSMNEFNFESKSTYNITITGSDGAGEALEEDYVISVTDINDAPTAVDVSSVEIEEAMAANSVVGEIAIEDEDSGDSHTYSLSGTDAGSFQVSGTELQSAAEFDFETKSSFTFTLTATDAGGLSVDQQFTVTVVDINEVPDALSLSASSIAEGAAAGTVVGNLSTEDQDANDSHTYTLSGTDAASFDINGSELINASVFNFEEKSTYDITVTTTDAGGLSINENYTIDVSDENDAPTAISISSEEVDEGQAAGTVVGSLSLTDEDANDTESYTISGTDAAKFDISGSDLTTAEELDFETQASFSITVTGTDSGGETISDDYVITVADVNEAPDAITLSNDQIAEGMAASSVVGDFSVDDQDAGDSHTLALSGTDADKFELSGTELLTSEEFNFEVQSAYNFTVTATDAGGLEVSESITVSVTDANDAPTSIALDNSEIPEGEDAGTMIGTLSVEDEDANDTHTFTITGADASSFQISGSTLQSAEVFDFDVKTSYDITIEASDGELTTSENFTITVSNVVGIGDENDRLIKVYPNPSNGIFTIALDPSLGTMQWRVFDIKGNQIQTAGNVVQINSTEITFDMTHLPAGEYIIEMTNGIKRITKPVIILH